MMKLVRTMVLTVGALSLAALGFAAPVEKGQMPPDFTGTTLDGKQITLSDFRGKNPVVLSFYADFCGPCHKEFPHLVEMDEKLGPKGLKVISVCTDEDRDKAENAPKESHAKFPIVFDPRNLISEKYNVEAIPHTVVIDKQGKVRTVLVGLNLEKLDQAVGEVMK